MIQRTLLALLIGAAIVVFVLPGQKTPADRVTQGGAIMPVRSIVDPYPVFNGIAVDSDNNQMIGLETNIGFVGGTLSARYGNPVAKWGNILSE